MGVDPGRKKVGYALVEMSGSVVVAGIESVERLPGCIRGLAALRPIDALALGKGTNVRAIRAALDSLGLPVHLVDEYETSRAARALYFREHPPHGWRRLIPIGLQVPPRPIDDYAAILIAQRFLARGAAARSPN